MSHVSTILEILTLAKEEPVPVDLIAAQLYDDEWPETYDSSIRASIKKLRQRLQGSGKDILRCRNTYRLAEAGAHYTLPGKWKAGLGFRPFRSLGQRIAAGEFKDRRITVPQSRFAPGVKARAGR